MRACVQDWTGGVFTMDPFMRSIRAYNTYIVCINTKPNKTKIKIKVTQKQISLSVYKFSDVTPHHITSHTTPQKLFPFTTNIVLSCCFPHISSVQTIKWYKTVLFIMLYF